MVLGRGGHPGVIVGPVPEHVADRARVITSEAHPLGKVAVCDHGAYRDGANGRINVFGVKPAHALILSAWAGTAAGVTVGRRAHAGSGRGDLTVTMSARAIL